MRLLNARTGEAVAGGVELALTRTARRRGLLGRDRLDPSTALLLLPCWAVHTAFMRFAIDVIFVDKDGRTVRVVRGLPPWRVAVAPGATAAIELAAGSLRPMDVMVGDRLYLEGTTQTSTLKSQVSRLKAERDRGSSRRHEDFEEHEAS